MVNRTNSEHKTYIFPDFYSQYLVLSTMVPRNSSVPGSIFVEYMQLLPVINLRSCIVTVDRTVNPYGTACM